MSGVKYNLRAQNCTRIIQITLKISFYIFLLIFFLIIHFYFFAKYNLISNRNYKQIEKKSIEVPGHFYVLTSQCQMPYVNPMLKMFKPTKYQNCTVDLPLYTYRYKKNLKHHVLELNKHLVQKYFPQIAKPKSDELRCRYNEIIRKAENDSFRLLETQILPEIFIVPRNISAMVVWCILKSTLKVVYSDSFAFVHYKYSRYKKKPAVLLIGIEGLSRINLRRAMPKTFEYLKSTWFELEGYNKVADYTFPNLMALLTGYNKTVALDKCQPTIEGGMDSEECELIWKTFRKYGYRTAYAEDGTEISTFNFMKKGFYEQPTYYYFRPMMLASSSLLKVKFRHGRPFCIGRKHVGEYIFDYSHQVAKVYEGESMFGLFWTNTFSHDNYDDVSMLDGQMLEYFKSFENDGILDSAIVIFFSDGGSRWSELQKVPEAFFEERLPTFFISLPKTFQHMHPDFVKALEVNRNRLTSPYDIHMTLKHILELYEPKLKLSHANGCKKCQSILHIIPENRTCFDAGITDHWCTCSRYTRVYTESSSVKVLTAAVVRTINNYLKAYNLETKCIMLKLHKIIEINLKVKELTFNQMPTYRIKFDVFPFNDIFEATFTFDPLYGYLSLLLEDYSRLTKIVPPTCIANNTNAEIFSKFCICRSYVNSILEKKQVK